MRKPGMSVEERQQAIRELRAEQRRKRASWARPTGSDSWTYSRYRATLRKNGRFFAIVTPDGSEGLSRPAEKILLKALNKSDQALPRGRRT